MSNESKPYPFIEFVSAFFEDKTKKPCADVSFSDGRVVRLYMGEAVCGSSAGPDLIRELLSMTEDYKRTADSGDCGNYRAEDQPVYQSAMGALRKAGIGKTMTTRRRRCGECSHLEGHKANWAKNNEWMCSCFCHERRISEVESRNKKRTGKTWVARVRAVYSSLEELQAYDEMYGIVERCGYKSAESLWKRNPKIGGSCNPRDFGVVRSGRSPS